MQQESKPELNSKFDEAIKRLQEIAERLNTKTSSGPYYTSKWAEEARKVIDEVYNTGHVVKIMYDGLSPVTVKCRWYQGLKYLCDHDPDYSKKADAIVASLLNDGLIVHFDPNRMPNKISYPKWKTELLEFIQSAKPCEIMRWIGLKLTPEDIEYLVTTVKQLGDSFVYDYDQIAGMLRIIRVK